MPSLLNHTLSKQNVTCNLLRTLEELIWMYIAVLGLKHPIKPEANQQKINLLHPADCLDLQMSLTFSPKYFLNNFQIYIFVNKMLGSNLVGQKPIYAAGKYSLRLWMKSCIMSELSAYKANWGEPGCCSEKLGKEEIERLTNHFTLAKPLLQYLNLCYSCNFLAKN